MTKKRSTHDWSSLIVTIATVVFACTALVTVIITITSWKEEREAARPYLTFKDSPAIDLKNGVDFELKFTNVGDHPATNLWSKTLVMEQGLQSKPIFVWQHSLVNDIPKNTVTSLLISIDKNVLNPNQMNINPHYIVVLLKYEDPLIRKLYAQAIYLKWNGVIGGNLQPIFHAEVEDRDKLLKYFETNKLNSQANI
ncbi:MAG: hypothetical protein ACYCVD_11675 [Desulfitobacteriaceae bacterium]